MATSRDQHLGHFGWSTVVEAAEIAAECDNDYLTDVVKFKVDSLLQYNSLAPMVTKVVVTAVAG